MSSKVHHLTEATKSDSQTNVTIAKFPIFLVAITLLFLCSMCTLTSADPGENDSIVKITYPTNESLVHIDEIVTGTAENIPEGQSLWIIVYPLTANKFYPQHGNVSVINGAWSLNVGLGDKEHVNEAFKILAVLADQESNEELTNYITTANNTGDWPGMGSIPEGAKVVDEVTVTRINSEIKITYPSNGSVVKKNEIATGTAKNVPEGQSLWIIVYPLTANKFYPQHGNVSVINGAWALNVGLGDEENVNEAFKILAVLADQESNEELTNYIITGNNTGKWPGMGSIPESAKTVDVVTVTRVGEGESSSSGGSSGGSGSGGGGSPEDQKNVEVKELSQVFITNGKAVKFNFTNNATCVVYIGFDSKKAVGRTTTIAEQLKKNSTRTSNLTGGEVYKYFNVWVGNKGYATSKNIENPTICFKIEKSWIKDKNIDNNSITLNRYSDKKWKKLSVNLSNENETYLYFISDVALTSNITCFSYFAITGTSEEASENKSTSLESDTRVESNISLSSSADSSKIGKSVMLTATVHIPSQGAEKPSGTVTFMDGDSIIGAENLSSGQAILNVSSLSVGSHSVTAQYKGNSKFRSSTSSVLILTVEERLTWYQKILKNIGLS